MTSDPKAMELVLTELDAYVSALQLKHIKENRKGLRELDAIAAWISRHRNEVTSNVGYVCDVRRTGQHVAHCFTHSRTVANVTANQCDLVAR